MHMTESDLTERINPHVHLNKLGAYILWAKHKMYSIRVQNFGSGVVSPLIGFTFSGAHRHRDAGV